MDVEEGGVAYSDDAFFEGIWFSGHYDGAQKQLTEGKR